MTDARGAVASAPAEAGAAEAVYAEAGPAEAAPAAAVSGEAVSLEAVPAGRHDAVHRWTVRVSATGREEATVFARKHQFVVGAPVSFDEKDERVSSLEYVLGALGAELVNGLCERARQRRLTIDHAEAVVQGELDSPLSYLGVVGATGHAGVQKVAIKVYVSTLEDESAITAVWEDLLERSPLVRTLRSAVRFDLVLKVSF